MKYVKERETGFTLPPLPSSWLTIIVVLGENQADKSPTVLAFGRGRRWSIALDPAQLLRQAQESLAQNGTPQPFTAAVQHLRIGARLQRQTDQQASWYESTCHFEV